LVMEKSWKINVEKEGHPEKNLWSMKCIRGIGLGLVLAISPKKDTTI